MVLFTVRVRVARLHPTVGHDEVLLVVAAGGLPEIELDRLLPRRRDVLVARGRARALVLPDAVRFDERETE